MISEDLKKMLASLGVSAEELKDAALYRAQAWLDDQKTSLDTETRRKCRMFWGLSASCRRLYVASRDGTSTLLWGNSCSTIYSQKLSKVRWQY